MQKVVLPSEPVVRAVTPNRAGGTPSKLRPSSTEKRPSSASKLFGRDMNLRTQTPTERRSSSARKVRRWESANMFGLQIHHSFMDELEEESTVDGKSAKARRSAFNAESKTQFQAMLESNDQTLLDRFRKCEEDLSVLRPKTEKSSYLDGIEGMTVAEKYGFYIEKGLLAVEKRARQVLMTKVSSNLSLIEFIFELEQLLFDTFNSSESSPASASSSSELLYNKQYWSNILDVTEDMTTVAGTLMLRFKSDLRNAAFIRLLVHGLSQFHRLSSKSFVDPKLSANNKYMIVKKMKTVSCTVKDRISLGSFLLVTLLNNLRDSEVSPISVPVYAAWEIDRSLFHNVVADVRAKLMISPETDGEEVVLSRTVSADRSLCADFVLVDINDFGVEDM